MTKPSLISMLLASTILAACSSQAQQATVDAAVPVLAVDVTAAQGGRILSVGTVRTTNSHELALEYGGRVIAFSANVGDQVRRGQVLASLDPAAFRAAADEAEANLAQARAALDEARSNEQRVIGLADAGVASQSDREQAVGAASQAAQRVLAAEAQARLAQRNLSQTSVVSPADGVIAARHAPLSSIIPPGGVLFSVDGGGDLEIETRIPGSVADKIQPGDVVSFRYGSEQGRAKLVGYSQRGDGVDIRQARFQVIEGAPAPGVAAEVALEISSGKADLVSIVPLSALVGGQQGEGQSIFAITPDGKLELVPVEIVEITSLGAEVRGDIAGRKIVAAGAVNLSLDRRVRPIPYTF